MPSAVGGVGPLGCSLRALACFGMPSPDDGSLARAAFERSLLCCSRSAAPGPGAGAAAAKGEGALRGASANGEAVVALPGLSEMAGRRPVWPALTQRSCWLTLAPA